MCHRGPHREICHWPTRYECRPCARVQFWNASLTPTFPVGHGMLLRACMPHTHTCADTHMGMAHRTDTHMGMAHRTDTHTGMAHRTFEARSADDDHLLDMAREGHPWQAVPTGYIVMAYVVMARSGRPWQAVPNAVAAICRCAAVSSIAAAVPASCCVSYSCCGAS